jgi:hypothetical protein
MTPFLVGVALVALLVGNLIALRARATLEERTPPLSETAFEER